MEKVSIKTSHKAIQKYYEALKRFDDANVKHETAVRSAFQDLLNHYCSKLKWKLFPEWKIQKSGGKTIWVDGALVDRFNLTHGFWEAKDSQDDLEKEAKKKFKQGYPRDNILFQSPDRAMLFQDSQLILDEVISDPAALVKVLEMFLGYRPQEYEDWNKAVSVFKEKIPDLAKGLVDLIVSERRKNKGFVQAFSSFLDLCKQAINPNISEEAVVEMLIQHLLTERIFRKVFDNSDFTNRNIVAVEIEKVINALTSRSFSRHDFLKSLDPFYVAIENTAATLDDFSQKQHFLNTVYEQFFQGYSVKLADTHGIVYTPQPIVDFMVKSVDHILLEEFGKSLGHKGVHIIDPFVGTGNFIVRIMREIRKTQLQRKYREEFHCNEVMLLPYYIASMNIEHEYYEKIGEYEPFNGVCLVDTFGLAESQGELFNDENTLRVDRQRKAPIFVVIGNPPYNQKQVNENDNNKNRKYRIIDGRVKETYSKDSAATNKNPLSDVYVKAYRWASDRIGDEGIVAFVSNNSFIDKIAFDGMRKHLAQDFDAIYVLDLGGDVRKNPKLSGTTHNVFGIQVGVSINLLVKKQSLGESHDCKIYYSCVDEFWRKEQKYEYLDESVNITEVAWRKLAPDDKFTWLTGSLRSEFSSFLSLAADTANKSDETVPNRMFCLKSNGLKSNRDVWVYNYHRGELEHNMRKTIDAYNSEVSRWVGRDQNEQDVDQFVSYDEAVLSWSRDLKKDLKRSVRAIFDAVKIRTSLYRPFSKQSLFLDRILNEEVYLLPSFFPSGEVEVENVAICVPGLGHRAQWAVLATDCLPNLSLTSVDSFQCFPFYIYDEDGSNRRENITDWALEEYRTHYDDKSITKWNIFYYLYGLLHHPDYRERYASNLRRELPRVPFAPDFKAFAEAGKELADLHINYEDQPEFELERVESEDVPLDWRVEKMKLSKDKNELIYNDFLTLRGIPSGAFDYCLGNRSALEWVIDQYRVKTDKRSGIVNDPNRDDPEYILRLIG